MIHTFDSDDELRAYLEAAAENADRLAEEHDLKVEDFQHGDHFVSVRRDFGCVIFGTVQTHDDIYPEDNVVIEESRRRGYLTGDCYSVLCVEGENGCTHISNVSAKISKAVFERAKANGWRHLKATN